MKYKYISFVAALFFPLIGIAEDSVMPWDTSNRMAFTLTKNNTDTTLLEAVVAYGSGGDKNIYFQLSYYDLVQDKTAAKDYCNPAEFNDRGIASVNGQAVKVIRWCKKFQNANEHYLQITALTDQGSNFIVNQLSKAPSQVELEVDGNKFKISAIGFSSVWNSLSQKAL